MKAQSSLEMLVTVAALMAFTLPIILLMTSMSQTGLEDISLSSGRSVAQRLSDNINEVYLQGDGARKSIVLDIPSNVQNLTVAGHMVTIYLSTSSGTYQVSHPLFADVENFSMSRSGVIPLTIWVNGTKVVLQ